MEQQHSQFIENKLKEHFSPTFILVKDQSTAENEGATKVIIVSSAFDQQPAMERHRMIYQALGNAATSALILQTFTPEEWAAKMAQVKQEKETVKDTPATTPETATQQAQPAQPQGDLPTLEQVEAAYIQKILTATEGHLGESCAILGITRPRLTRKIEKYDLTVPNRHLTAFDLSKPAPNASENNV